MVVVGDDGKLCRSNIRYGLNSLMITHTLRRVVIIMQVVHLHSLLTRKLVQIIRIVLYGL